MDSLFSFASLTQLSTTPTSSRPSCCLLVSNVGILLLLSSDLDCVDISAICGVFLLFHNIVVVEQLYKKRWMTTWESHAGSSGDGEYYCGKRGRMWEEQEQRQQFELSFKQVMGGNVPAECWS